MGEGGGETTVGTDQSWLPTTREELQSCGAQHRVANTRQEPQSHQHQAGTTESPTPGRNHRVTNTRQEPQSPTPGRNHRVTNTRQVPQSRQHQAGTTAKLLYEWNTHSALEVNSEHVDDRTQLNLFVLGSDRTMTETWKSVWFACSRQVPWYRSRGRRRTRRVRP